MPKQQTIRQWSEGRKKRVFRRRAATLTKNLVRDVSSKDDALDFSRREIELLSRKVARDILAAMQSPDFIKSASSYAADCTLDSEDVLPKVEDAVLSSMDFEAG